MTIYEKFEREIKDMEWKEYGFHINHSVANNEHFLKSWKELLNKCLDNPEHIKNVIKEDDTQELILADRELLSKAQLDYDDTINRICKGAWNELGILLRLHILPDVLQAMESRDEAIVNRVKEAIHYGAQELEEDMFKEWENSDDNIIDSGDYEVYAKDIGMYFIKEVRRYMNNSKTEAKPQPAKEDDYKEEPISNLEELLSDFNCKDADELEKFINANHRRFWGTIHLCFNEKSMLITGHDIVDTELTSMTMNFPFTRHDLRNLIAKTNMDMREIERMIDVSGCGDYPEFEMKLEAIHNAMSRAEEGLCAEFRQGYRNCFEDYDSKEDKDYIEYIQNLGAWLRDCVRDEYRRLQEEA